MQKNDFLTGLDSKLIPTYALTCVLVIRPRLGNACTEWTKTAFHGMYAEGH